MEDPQFDADGCIEIKWHPISEKHRNGILRGYRVSYATDCFSEEDPSRHSGNVDVSASTFNFKLCQLRPALQYRIGVAASTSKGPGHFNHRDVFTSKCLVIIAPFNNTNSEVVLNILNEL